jgi:hypothetical protein
VPLPFCGVGFGPVCNAAGFAVLPHAPGTPIESVEDRVGMFCCADKNPGNNKNASNMKGRSGDLILIGIK